MVCLVSGYMGRLLYRRRLLYFGLFERRFGTPELQSENFCPNFERF